MTKILRSAEVRRELIQKGVSWDFIIERAPWHGGFWERMIGSVKRCLKKSIGRTPLNIEALRTLLVEIETTINNRPLTYMYDDAEGVSYPLSPSQLIYGRQIALTPNERHFAVVSTNQSLTRRAKPHNRLLRQFAKRWRNEYLLNIRESARVLNSDGKVNELRRPLQHLIPLELHINHELTTEVVPDAAASVNKKVPEVEFSKESPRRSKRTTAIIEDIE